MKSLLLATNNPAKLVELKMGLSSLLKKGVKILSLNDLSIKDKPEESGKTFCQNALLKAKFYSDLTGLPTIGDDGGLVIPVLNNQPGVKSRRWLGYEASDEELINYTLKKLQGLTKKRRVAYLQTCLCFYNPKTKTTFCEQEKIIGYIAEKPSGNPTAGYPFRALFIVDEYNKYYDQLTKEQHKKINHRLIALKRLIKRILWLNGKFAFWI